MRSAPSITWTDGTLIWSDICKYIHYLLYYTHKDWVNILKSPHAAGFNLYILLKQQPEEQRCAGEYGGSFPEISPLTWKSNKQLQILPVGKRVIPLTEHLCAWMNCWMLLNEATHWSEYKEQWIITIGRFWTLTLAELSAWIHPILIWSPGCKSEGSLRASPCLPVVCDSARGPRGLEQICRVESGELPGVPAVWDHKQWLLDCWSED